MTPTERQQLLSQWIKPSSDTEQDQQDRAKRMVEDAIAANPSFSGAQKRVYVKGSYANNTNVRQDSDVDVVVELTECHYYDYSPGIEPGESDHPQYGGLWTPILWRGAVQNSLVSAFGSESVSPGRIAINIAAVPGSRPSADVVPSFSYVRYDAPNRGSPQPGSCVFPSDGSVKIVNFPQQQLDNGRAKNTSTGGRYKNSVRALKNAENVLSAASTISNLPSYFMEGLTFNVANAVLQTGSLDDGFRATLVELWQRLEGDAMDTMLEPSQLKWLFRDQNKWSVEDAKALVMATWNYLGYGS